jgi:hypothetical protein
MTWELRSAPDLAPLIGIDGKEIEAMGENNRRSFLVREPVRDSRMPHTASRAAHQLQDGQTATDYTLRDAAVTTARGAAQRDPGPLPARDPVDPADLAIDPPHSK